LPRSHARAGGDHQAFAGSHPDELGFEFRDHGQDVEQQPAHGVHRIVNGSAEVELDLAGGELITMSRASGSERASRSSLVTTRVSP